MPRSWEPGHHPDSVHGRVVQVTNQPTPPGDVHMVDSTRQRGGGKRRLKPRKSEDDPLVHFFDDEEREEVEYTRRVEVANKKFEPVNKSDLPIDVILARLRQRGRRYVEHGFGEYSACCPGHADS